MRRNTIARAARFALAVSALSVSAWVLAVPANAHDTRHRHGGHRHHDRHVHRKGPDRHARSVARFVVPTRIRSFEVYAYRPYRRGFAYHRGHRHSHAVYVFPTYTRYGVAYRPHEYCDGRLFRDVRLTYHGRNVGFSVRF